MRTRPRSSTTGRRGPRPPAPGKSYLSLDGAQVVVRRCTRCDWEAQVVEQAGDDPPCPQCHGPSERRAIVGLVVPQHLRPGQKNPYAASLGRLGGLKGGRARAASLTAKQRKEIATKAARARWGTRKR